MGAEAFVFPGSGRKGEEQTFCLCPSGEETAAGLTKLREERRKANDKKLVEAITSMEDDFAQWYTDVVKKAELIELYQCKWLYGDQACRIRHLGKYPEGAGREV